MMRFTGTRCQGCKRRLKVVEMARTNVVNMVDIAKALARPASYTTKYFGYELGEQSKFDEKTGVALVNGAHDTAKLAGLLENFIKKFASVMDAGSREP
ncbi:hypothetical protein C5167_035346 [Papaver somniferum]|uniref:Translation initiation factor IF2/IF5 domain-containing protein n=1 Tax=Papaver somniferum TaxID=3469 RepID=A0A4Y7KH44_PAPSO|nr:hypothetical protein C5167_035346 [Papaver somniferum]